MYEFELRTNERLSEVNQELEKAKKAAEEAFHIAEEANQSKSRFLSNMSHDMRTPMNAIVGFTTLLDNESKNPEKVQEYTKKIAFSSQHLLGLINDVLDMSKIEAGKMKLTLEEENMDEIIENIDASSARRWSFVGRSLRSLWNCLKWKAQNVLSAKMDSLR